MYVVDDNIVTRSIFFFFRELGKQPVSFAPKMIFVTRDVVCNRTYTQRSVKKTITKSIKILKDKSLRKCLRNVVFEFLATNNVIKIYHNLI